MTTSERAQTMTQPDTVENGRDEAGDPGPRTGSHALDAGIRAVLRPEPWRRGLIVAALAVLLGLLIALHAMIPNRVGNLGSLVETFLPWFGLLIPVLLAGALWRRSASATAALLLPVVAWLNLFGGHLVDKSAPGGDLTVTSHNVGADNPEPARTARALAASDADVLALQELTQQTRATYERELAAAYPHHTVQGTVGLWSKLPLSNTWPVDIQMDYGPLAATKPAATKMSYNRALRTTVTTDQGPLAVYVAHLGSARVNPRAGFWTTHRDRGAKALAEAIAAEPNERVVLLADLNGSLNDRAFNDITAQLRSTHDAAGTGFHFTWPAKFPLIRIDHILTRGVTPKSASVLPPTPSDHRPITTAITW